MDIASIEESYAGQLTQPWLCVDVSRQLLWVIENTHIVNEYEVSTSRYGVGNKQDSYKTPLGAHAIKQKIGDGAALGEIFKARQASGQQAQIIFQPEHDYQDLILTRILWLTGLEPGHNSGPGIDSYTRYIYLHGTQEEGLLGQAVSKGCVRMANQTIIDLFKMVEEGTFVYIADNTSIR
jgi:hypothetical protein